VLVTSGRLIFFSAGKVGMAGRALGGVAASLWLISV
jgi:hypothetical protein